MANQMFEHNQLLGQVRFTIGDCVVSFQNAIVWTAELDGDYAIAEYGTPISSFFIGQNATITKINDQLYRIE